MKQLENRKAYMARKLVGGWEFRTASHVREWASSRMCQTKEVFDALPAADTGMFVLDFFEADVRGEDGEIHETFGLIVSSKALFANIARSVAGQPDSLLCSTDGTYKLHFGGWTLVDIGSEAVVYSRNEYVHRFVPWAYMFVRTESEVAYERMFRVVQESAHAFLEVDVDVKYGSLDHSWAIANAFRSVWPEVQLLSCWPHVIRQCRKKRTLLADRAQFDGMILPQIRLMHTARSEAQFTAVSRIFVQGWAEAGEEKYAEWFSDVYLAQPWSGWHVAATLEPGILPSQQAIESHHASIKRVAVDKSRAPTSVVLSSILPRILLMDAATAVEHVRHYAVGPLPAETLVKAQLLLRNSGNYRTVTRRKHGRITEAGIAFNSKAYAIYAGNINGAVVTKQRVDMMMDSLNGELEDDAHGSNLAFDVLSLQVIL